MANCSAKRLPGLRCWYRKFRMEGLRWVEEAARSLLGLRRPELLELEPRKEAELRAT